jgi:hydroxymethylglutaryl-CoA lyase
MASAIKITECPRDAMQGLHPFIPTELKATYINLLLGVGFDTIDFGSFVSPKAIPQMRDTADMLQKLKLDNTRSKLLAIIANYRGAEEAASHEQITYLGFPFSISETFQRRNTNSGITESFETVKKIQGLCISKKKKLRIYLSMGFGNPYGDAWSVDLLNKWADEMTGLGIDDIYLADTIGVATSGQITQILKHLTGPGKVNFGMHLHSTPDTWQEKIEAAYIGGCHLFDSTLKGYGGCPMAKDELTGNIATENLIEYLSAQNEHLGLNMDKLSDAMDFSVKIFA